MKIVAYEERFGEIKFPEGFAEKLAGKSLEEQMDCYRITESATLARTAYGKITDERTTELGAYALDRFDRFEGLVVKDGLLVGVLIKPWWSYDGPAPCLPYQRVCTYYASDNEGSGTNDREDYAYLICV